MANLLIIGAGGHGRSVAEAVSLAGEHQILGFLDDAFPGLGRVWDFPVLGKIADFPELCREAQYAFVAIGNNALREQIALRLLALAVPLLTVIHPRAIVSPSAVLGAGTAVMAGAIVGTEAQLGCGVIVNCGAVADHHCVVEDFGHLGVNACMAGGSRLGNKAWMQAGSALGYGVSICSGRLLAPGEAVSATTC